MNYKVTISGVAALQECIEFVSFKVESTPDDYKGKAYTLGSMIIEGKIGTDEKTVPLYKWASIPSTSSDCYKEITVEQTHADQLLRKVTFSKAFVVDYSEFHIDKAGEGCFSLHVRQFVGDNIECSDGSPKQTPINDNIADKIFNRKFGSPQPKGNLVNNDSMKLIEGMGGRPTDLTERFTEEKGRKELATSKVGQQTLEFIDKHNLQVGLTYEPPPDKFTQGVYLQSLNITKVFLENHHEGGIMEVAQTTIHEVTHHMGIRGSKRAEMLCRIRELKHIYKNMRIPKSILKEQYDIVYNGKEYSKLPLGNISDILDLTKGWGKFK